MDDDSPIQKLLLPMVSRTLKTGRVETKGAMPPNYPKPTVFLRLQPPAEMHGQTDVCFSSRSTFHFDLEADRRIKFKKKYIFCTPTKSQKTHQRLPNGCVELFLEHHFDRHEGCGEWCPMKQWKNEPEKLEKLCYRDKDRDRKTYLQSPLLYCRETGGDAPLI
jgi:hypothetical protein